jgi:hypothetical protein
MLGAPAGIRLQLMRTLNPDRFTDYANPKARLNAFHAWSNVLPLPLRHLSGQSRSPVDSGASLTHPAFFAAVTAGVKSTEW